MVLGLREVVRARCADHFRDVGRSRGTRVGIFECKCVTPYRRVFWFTSSGVLRVVSPDADAVASMQADERDLVGVVLRFSRKVCARSRCSSTSLNVTRASSRLRELLQSVIATTAPASPSATPGPTARLRRLLRPLFHADARGSSTLNLSVRANRRRSCSRVPSVANGIARLRLDELLPASARGHQQVLGRPAKRSLRRPAAQSPAKSWIGTDFRYRRASSADRRRAVCPAVRPDARQAVCAPCRHCVQALRADAWANSARNLPDASGRK